MFGTGFGCTGRIGRGRAAQAWRTLLIYAVVYATLLAWSSSISASNDKNWAADVVHGITGVVDGDGLSAHNVRNFNWRTETDYTEGWEQRTYDLSNCDRSIFSLFIGWGHLLPTRL
jgi:hypothetical protein